MSARMIKATTEGTIVDVRKRAFMKKFGQYAIAGAGMATLMTPTLSSAQNYDGRGTGSIVNHVETPITPPRSPVHT